MFLLQVVNTLCVRGVISLGVGATGSVTVLIIDIFWLQSIVRLLSSNCGKALDSPVLSSSYWI
ncbi:unnamed protein product [Brassica rapa]|uniref:Uncharacterized protein n=1 Tax=Brassica campestris TaxID=3711 RepID=A0A3P6BD06_BRACM|nr:unnamed protein product [Brassica rapa]VDC95730.1 unnamed protein product [Brassica rapa]